MNSLLVFLRCAMPVAVCLGVSGCARSGSARWDEQKEPHFLTGKGRVNAMDYPGAIEAFEKALEVNPRSAAAHFELGVLYETKEMDYASAIYHFERYLKLQPDSEYREVIKSHVMSCKIDLAKAVGEPLATPAMPRDLERLAAENRELRQKLEAWQVYYANRSPSASSQSGAAPVQRGTPGASVATQPVARQSPTGATVGALSTATTAASGPAARTHTIQPGESPYSIAKKYRVKVDVLLAANPKIDPRKLQIGQTVSIPAL